MKRVAVRNLNRPGIEPLTVVYCASFLCQLRGLTFRRHLPPNEGLLLVQTKDSRLGASIHMMGVWIDLGVVWVSSSGEVVDTCLARRWRPAYVPCRPAKYVLEMVPRRLEDFQIGDKVKINEA